MRCLIFAVVAIACVYGLPIEERVVGGQNAQRGQFTSVASHEFCLLGIICQHVCGSTILTSLSVLTAAHCITELPALGTNRIRAGRLLINDPAALGQTISISSGTVHPNYAGGVNPNDIAIFTLAEPLVFNAEVQPAQLPPAGQIPTATAILAGWGSTSNTSASSMPNNLQYLIKNLITITQCADALTSVLGTTGPLADTNVCAGEWGASACSGDSGGPLYQGSVVIGIVSWGVVPCGASIAPSVYTRVSAFIDFIQSNIIN